MVGKELWGFPVGNREKIREEGPKRIGRGTGMDASIHARRLSARPRNQTSSKVRVTSQVMLRMRVRRQYSTFPLPFKTLHNGCDIA